MIMIDAAILLVHQDMLDGGVSEAKSIEMSLDRLFQYIDNECPTQYLI